MRIAAIRFSVLLIAVVAAAFAGCVTTWTATPGPQRASRIAVTADLPPGWVRYNPEPGLVMTRDGLLLQTVRVTRDAYGTKLPNTERTISNDAEPYEAAQIMIDALQADRSRQHLRVLDNRPATVGGHPGFRIEYTYRTADGLTLHETVYVALTEDSYVTIRYTAPHRYYHERDAGTFEQVVASLKIDPLPAKS